MRPWFVLVAYRDGDSYSAEVVSFETFEAAQAFQQFNQHWLAATQLAGVAVPPTP